MLPIEVKQALLPVPSGKTLIITVGNDLRRDDGAGSFISSRLKEIPEGYVLLDVGSRPENSVDEAVDLNPAKTVIIDAADFGGEPGEIRIIPPELIPQTTLSTHTFPLPVIAKMLEEETGSAVYFLGIQPVSVELGEGLSPEVEKSAGDIIRFIKEGESHA